MQRLDCNCFAGPWPFHKLRNSTMADLVRLHGDNQIEGGFVSSTSAIFYNDPEEADMELARELPQGYRHVITVNPTLPGCLETIRRECASYPVAGVRVLPGIHGYPLFDPALGAVLDLMEELGLTLFLTLRMEDMRAEYLLHSQAIPIWDVMELIQGRTRLPILLCNLRAHEVDALKDVLLAQENVYFDCSGLKDGLFKIEAFDNAGLTRRMVYGSTAAVFCLKSTLLLIEKARIPQQKKEGILTANGFLEKVTKQVPRA